MKVVLMPRKFLFVSGCPRSGTTVLAHIVNWSDSVLVGQERFANLLNREPTRFLPSLFASERLTEIEPGDCGDDILAENFAWYANPKNFAAADATEVVGDKITNLYIHLEALQTPEWHPHDVKLIHVVRNVFDVAASYQARKISEPAAWSADYQTAVADWSYSVEIMSRLMASERNNISIGIVNYDAIFGSDLSHFLLAVRAIYAFLGLEFGLKQEIGMTLLFKAGEQRREQRRGGDALQSHILDRLSGEILAKHAALTSKAIC